jgi:SOS-response transcriptional repressor LexA
MNLLTTLRVKEMLREKGWTTKILAEKTGLSESYLTHIKNGTRRWNEDSLRKLASAFEINPVDLFIEQRKRTDNIEKNVKLSDKSPIKLNVFPVPVLGDIPAIPSPYNNQLIQTTTGHANEFVPFFNNNDNNIFAYHIDNNLMSPIFTKGDVLIISPETWARSGDIAAVEYGNDTLIRSIVRVAYTENFVVLESINQKNPPVALIRGNDHFRIIGRVVQRLQNFI